MPIPSSITDLSTNPASNSPLGSESPTAGDDYMRAIQAIMRQTYDVSVTEADLAGTGADQGGNMVHYHGPDDATAGSVNERLSHDIYVTDPQFAGSPSAAVGYGAGKRVIFPAGTYTITAALAPADQTEIVLMQGAVLQSATANIDMIDCTGKTGVRIVGPGTIRSTGTGTTAYHGGVRFDASTDCEVEGVTFEGMQWSAVFMKNATRCHARKNNVRAFQSTLLQDSSDIAVLEGCVGCRVEYNELNGGDKSCVGVLVQDPYAINKCPNGTVVRGNKIGAHACYGVALYMPARRATFTGSITTTVLTVTAVSGGALAVGDLVASTTDGVYYSAITSLGTGTGGTGTYNLASSHTASSTSLATASLDPTNTLIEANEIQDIEGSAAYNTSSGAGIYMVGSGVSGAQVRGNHVENCCTDTAARTLAPAGISLNGAPAGCVRPIIEANTITRMSQGDGVLIVSSPGGAVIGPNSVDIPAASTGAGPGGSVLAGTGLRIENSKDVDVTGGSYVVSGSSSACLLFSNGTGISDIRINGGTYTSAGAGAATMRHIQTGGVTGANVSIQGARVRQLSTSNNALSLASLAGVTLSNNTATTAGAFAALIVSAVTQLRVTGGSYLSASSTCIQTSGTCTDGLIDESVYWGTSSTRMVNAATGLNVRWNSTGVPLTGTWAVGDVVRVINAAAGGVPAYQCTTPGAAGTFVFKAHTALAA